MTKTKLNIESWNRKEHFRFFSAFDDPFFGITTNVDFTTIYLEAKHDSQSFFLYSRKENRAGSPSTRTP